MEIMGYYQERRQEFRELYGFFPKADLLNCFLNSPIDCKTQMINNFIINKKNRRYKSEFVNKFGFEPNNNDLYSFSLDRENRFIPSKIIFTLLVFFDLFESKNMFLSLFNRYNFHGSFIEKNEDWCDIGDFNNIIYEFYNDQKKRKRYFYLLTKYDYAIDEKECEKKYIQAMKEIEILYNKEQYLAELYKLLKEIYKISTYSLQVPLLLYKYEIKNKSELLQSIKDGKYSDDFIKDLFCIRRGTEYITINSFFDKFIRNNNIEYLHLPESENIDTIYLDNDIKIFIPSHYYYYECGEKCIIELESLKYLCWNLDRNKGNNLEKIYQCFLSEFIEKFKFTPSDELLQKYMTDKLAFVKHFKELIKYLKTGKFKKNNLINIVSLFECTVRNEWFDNFFRTLSGKVFYAPPINVNFDFPILPNSFSGTMIISKNFKKETYSGLTYNSKTGDITYYGQPNYKIIIEDPYNNIDKIKGLVGTHYYEEFCTKFLKKKTIYELKYFFAPDCVKEQLKIDPDLKIYVVESYNLTWNNGVDKIYWSDMYEAYHWNEENKFWMHIYDYDHGSD